jgi:hypothetical protein
VSVEKFLAFAAIVAVVAWIRGARYGRERERERVAQLLADDLGRK